VVVVVVVVCSDLGVHIDGYSAVLAHTLVVSDAKVEASKTITGKAAQVVTAAHTAAEIALRMLKPGNTVCYGSALLCSVSCVLC
jgi:methionine aminopeptidase